MERFTFTASTQRSEHILIGASGSFRLTVLTPCLVRLEKGEFTDLPTQTVWNRDLGEVRFAAEHDGSLLRIRTDKAVFLLDAARGRMRGITLADGTAVTDFRKGNLLGTARTLDMANGARKLEKGIISTSGVSVLDDSSSLLLKQDGSILARKPCRDLYFFAYGHDYRLCLQDFFRLTGQVPLIPKYALGNWWSRYKAYTQQEYRELMETFLKREIPITVATIDMDWHWTDVVSRFGDDAKPGAGRCKEEIFYNRVLPGWTGYSWNTGLFPDHRELLRWLHDRGFYVTLNVHPSQGIRYFEDCYEAVCKALGRDPEKRETVTFDIADPRFVEVYLDKAHHPHEADGVDFWWLDWQQGRVTDIPGLDPLWALNHYHTLDSGRGDKRPLILSRYAGLGSHRYPLGFSGDTICTWKSLRFQPYFTANAANAGYTWWSHDIGGHMRGIQDDELYLRWLQFGVFSPINRLHSSNSDYMGKEPWKRCAAVRGVAEDFLRLRHKLIPFLYTANYRTHTDGTPICMPLYYLWDRQEAYEARNCYIFGGSLLVSPVTEPLDRRLNLARSRVWLPEGRWTDIFTGQIYRGGQLVTMYRDLDSIPVLAPAGAIVPMYRDSRTNDLSLDQPLEIHVWRGNGRYELYEDDGETKAHARGSFVITPMEVSEDGDTLRFTISAPRGDAGLLPQRRTVHIRFRDVERCGIFVDGSASAGSGAGCPEVAVELQGRAVHIELRNCVWRKNPPIRQNRTDLLARLQCSNRRKAGFEKHSNRRMPAFLKRALAEFNALDHTI